MAWWTFVSRNWDKIGCLFLAGIAVGRILIWWMARFLDRQIGENDEQTSARTPCSQTQFAVKEIETMP